MKRIISAMFTLLRERPQFSPERCSDSELIARFVRTNDSAALELLFLRHGPLVWSVCCRILGASAEAEDAFQATFVVLARKARTITNRSAFALEFIGNAEAIKLLDELAEGSKDDTFTQSAMDVREWLRKRK